MDENNRGNVDPEFTGEQLFRNMFLQHTAVMLLIDPSTGRIIDANHAAERFYGWTRDRLRRMTVQEINTLSPEQVHEQMEKARNTGQVRFEFLHRLADGGVRNVEVFSSRIEAGGREILHSIIHDITERKQAEMELTRRERNFSELIEQSPVVYELYDTNGLLIRVNAAWEKLWDIPRTRSIEHYNILQDRQISDNGWMPYIENAFRGFASNGPEIEFESSTGQEPDVTKRKRWITTIAYPVKDDAGQVLNVVVLHEDITERKLAEGQLNLMKRTIDVLPEAVYWFGTDNKISYVNDAGCEILGYTRDELLGMDVVRINPRATAETMARIWDVLRSRGSVTRDSVHRCKDGTEFPVEIRSNYVQFEG
jgi:PAS domain S-box-containing protein